MNSGVYEILNTVSGERYIGSATDFARRWRGHKTGIPRGRPNGLLRDAWAEYGAAAFEFRVLELCAPTKKALLACEQKWVDALGPGYNVAKVVGAPALGHTHSQETRAQMSASHTGVKRPDQAARMQGNTYSVGKNVGHVHTAEMRSRMSVAQMGNTNSAGVAVSKGRLVPLSLPWCKHVHTALHQQVSL